MRTAPPQMLPIFRSEAQLRMLARLLLEPDSPATMDELRRASRMGTASLHRELMRVIDAGLVERDDRRRPHLFRAIVSSPMYDAVASLLRMTVGIEHDLRALLHSTPGVEAAALHGSWAEGTARPDSDIDVLVVGDDIDGHSLRARLRELGQRAGREIDLMLVSRKSFDELLGAENPFLRLVIERPLVNLVGDVTALSAA